MARLNSRDKGRRAESEAAKLLIDLGWEIVELGPGRQTEDILAVDPNGVKFSVEVKNRVVWDLRAFRRQAKEQAARRGTGWLLMVRIPGMPGKFYVEGSWDEPGVWSA